MSTTPTLEQVTKVHAEISRLRKLAAKLDHQATVRTAGMVSSRLSQPDNHDAVTDLIGAQKCRERAYGMGDALALLGLPGFGDGE